ncbi:MAG: hypothetical protein GVY14_04155 [Spirochaetes bacterium]|jgi:hypothetical protein|nr:hypothetical protein [Spirochaetota bacterium]
MPTPGGGETPVRADDAEFTRFLSRQTDRLAGLCEFAQRSREVPEFPCRDFLSQLNREATRVEELVDAHGAQTNEKWFPFREVIAAAKLFSAVTHQVLHIRDGMSRYRLLGVDNDLKAATAHVVDVMQDAILIVCDTVRAELGRCDLGSDSDYEFEPCVNEMLPFRLEADRTVRHTERVGETVVYLATQFLNLSEDTDVREVVRTRSAESYDAFIPEPISEERLRIVEARFHNLQSMYDTYIFESDIEEQNGDLPILRGHISLIYHLLAVATDVVHYYVRHMSSLRRDTFLNTRFPMAPAALCRLLFDYPLHYSRLYLDSAVQLCQSMIRAYSEQTSVEVPIPNYRGFHVRPSTLVAKIVAHYGSPVTMKLGEEEYDAGSSLDLFRANEAINAAKRRYIADMLNRRPELQVKVPTDREERTRELQLLFVQLMNEGKIVLYDSRLSFDEIKTDPQATLAEFAARYVVHLMSVAKMDIRSDIAVTFTGDSRAVNDLRTLAENGYGEDDMGNNIMLPEELSYLSR